MEQQQQTYGGAERRVAQGPFDGDERRVAPPPLFQQPDGTQDADIPGLDAEERKAEQQEAREEQALEQQAEAQQASQQADEEGQKH